MNNPSLGEKLVTALTSAGFISGEYIYSLSLKMEHNIPKGVSVVCEYEQYDEHSQLSSHVTKAVISRDDSETLLDALGIPRTGRTINMSIVAISGHTTVLNLGAYLQQDQEDCFSKALARTNFTIESNK